MIIVQTPLRISFFGGGTDFEGFYLNHGGAVLSSAIDKYVFVIVEKRFDDAIVLSYTKREKVENVDQIQHDLIREAMKIVGIEKGIDITTLADIPAEGTGLGSSSSITVALLHALYVYKNELKTAKELAEKACSIEINILKKSIGKQDQYIAAFGNTRFITFNNKVTVKSIKISPDNKRRLNENLMLFFTGVTRKSEDILREQKENIDSKLTILKDMKSLVYEGKFTLENGYLDDFGELLDHNWLLKKQLASKVTNNEVDSIYQEALKCGAIGGKITGAGGGGFLLLYVPTREKQDGVRQSLRGLRELPFKLEEEGTKVIFNYKRN